MTVPHQPYRQVHLDFHTALQCEGVGAEFDPEQFASTLKEAHVASINVIAKCHHGYSYYPTQVGTMHPNLTFDLLGQQIEALHKAGIRCPVYLTVKWDDLAGIQHPEWVIVDRQGRAVMRPPLSGEWGWTALDMASGYADYVVAQTEEIMDRYDVDAMWFDICFTIPNYSTAAQERMRRGGVDLEDEAAVRYYAEQQDQVFFKRLTEAVRRKKASAAIFYNGTVDPAMRRMLPYLTHFEVESLPTSGGTWGYMHYPLVARQARTYGVEMVGMTGRFHKSWGDFGGLKTHDQLDYECGTILAAGGRICVGDQLHPRGVLDPAVYRLIGKSFERVEQLEPWLENAVPAAEVGILALGQPVGSGPGIGAYSPDVEGAAQMFLETGIQFDILDPQADLSAYPTVLIPNGARLERNLAGRVNAYLSQGGKLILSGTAAYDPAAQAFQIEGVPVTLEGPVPTVPSYFRLNGAEEIVNPEVNRDYDYAFYDEAFKVRPVAGAAATGELRSALFNRTWEHFTSHAHAPVGEALDSPLAVRRENVLYFAAPLFGAYRTHDYWIYRAVAVDLLRSFLPPALIRPHGPGWAEFTLHVQGARRIVHGVCYHPRRTSQPINHVDQSWPTAGLAVDVRTDGWTPSKVYLAPECTPLVFSLKDGYIHIDLPPVGVHTVVVIE